MNSTTETLLEALRPQFGKEIAVGDWLTVD